MSLRDRVHEEIDSTGRLRPLFDLASALYRRPILPKLADRVMPLPLTGPPPLFSVVVPCYNYGRFLDAAVRSALGQEGVEVEVIVVDDASTDDTAVVASALEDEDGRVRLLRHRSNEGHVRSFNDGWAQASGEFLARLDADDLLTPGSLRRAADLFRAFPNVGLVYGHPRHFETPEPPPAWTGTTTWTVWPGREWIAERCRRAVNCITTPEAVVRASVMEPTGRLNTRLRFAQDMEMWLRAAAVADVGHIDDTDQALHRDHPMSMSVTQAVGALTDLYERRQVFDCLWQTVGDLIPEREALETMARRALAREAIASATYLHDRGRYDAETVAKLMAFAESTCPGSSAAHNGPAVGSPGATRRRTPFSLARLARNRWESEIAYLRWTRLGL